MTRVLPLPGPARISTGPSVIVTAFFCGSLSPANKSFCSNIVSSSASKRNIMRSILLRVCLQLNPCYCITVNNRRLKAGGLRLDSTATVGGSDLSGDATGHLRGYLVSRAYLVVRCILQLDLVTHLAVLIGVARHV